MKLTWLAWCVGLARQELRLEFVCCMPHICFYWLVDISLLLALVLVEFQNTCKKKLNRKMLERPNICYIFGKLGVQGCQIWHSHVSIPFNLAATHSTRPHNAKKALYVIISCKIPENWVHKSCWHKLIFLCASKNKSFVPVSTSPRGMFGPNNARECTMENWGITHVYPKFKDNWGQKT